MKTTHLAWKKSVWIVAVLVLASLACNITVATPEPTMTIPRAQPAEPVPTAQPAELAPTAAPVEPTPTPEPPTVEIISDQVKTEILIGETVEISYLAQGKNGIPRVALTLDSIDGQLLDSQGIPDAQGETSLQDTFTWKPDKPGEYNVFLTAFDTQERASAPATLTITVFQRPNIITSGFIFLGAEDSIDFVSGEIGNLTGGDLYIYKHSDTDYRALANNVPQIGGQLLFDADKAVNMGVEVYDASHFVNNTETIKKVAAANTQSNFTYLEVPLETYAVYLYQRNQAPGEYVLFTVAGVDSDGVALDYAVFEMPD